MENHTIILTGGGTAGHVTLNIKLKDELKKYFNKIVYIGSYDGIEKELIKKNTDFEYIPITTVKFDRKKLFKNLSIPFKLSKGVNQAKEIIKKYQPEIIFSKGGYVGLPVVIAGNKLKVPVICHESDITMGLANKLAKKHATVICTNFAKTAEENGEKCIYTGMPIKVSPLSKEEAKQNLGIYTHKPVLLVTGGSLGAVAINKFIFECISKLTLKYYVIHLVGKNNKNKNITLKDYKQIEFSNDMSTILRASDFAISRAGANTVIELLSNNILTIFIPLPKTASRGDQIENSKYLESKNLCATILQEELTYDKLQNTLNFLENNANLIHKSIKSANFEDGTKKIINIINQNKKHISWCAFCYLL